MYFSLDMSNFFESLSESFDLRRISFAGSYHMPYLRDRDHRTNTKTVVYSLLLDYTRRATTKTSQRLTTTTEMNATTPSNDLAASQTSSQSLFPISAPCFFHLASVRVTAVAVLRRNPL